jgi:hypothetical protein
MTLRQEDSCRGKQEFVRAKLLKFGDLRGGMQRLRGAAPIYATLV